MKKHTLFGMMILSIILLAGFTLWSCSVSVEDNSLTSGDDNVTDAGSGDDTDNDGDGTEDESDGGDDTAEFTVTYDDNGADSGDAPADTNVYEEGDTVTVLGNTGGLAKDGYNFAGWYLESGGNQTVYMILVTIFLFIINESDPNSVIIGIDQCIGHIFQVPGIKTDINRIFRRVNSFDKLLFKINVPIRLVEP